MKFGAETETGEVWAPTDVNLFATAEAWQPEIIEAIKHYFKEGTFLIGTIDRKKTRTPTITFYVELLPAEQLKHTEPLRDLLEQGLEYHKGSPPDPLAALYRDLLTTYDAWAERHLPPRG